MRREGWNGFTENLSKNGVSKGCYIFIFDLFWCKHFSHPLSSLFKSWILRKTAISPKGKIFSHWKMSISNKVCERILMLRRNRSTSLDIEKFMVTWISPIRHIQRSARKYGFCAICVHIKKLFRFLDFSKQYYFVTLLQWWPKFTRKEQSAHFYILAFWKF